MGVVKLSVLFADAFVSRSPPEPLLSVLDVWARQPAECMLGKDKALSIVNAGIRFLCGMAYFSVESFCD